MEEGTLEAGGGLGDMDYPDTETNGLDWDILEQDESYRHSTHDKET
jgi:hypothetical protein